MHSVKVSQVNQRLIPKRGTLYNIEPIGMGTPYVESLTSYIKRIAYYHNVNVKDLMGELIVPETNDSSIRIRKIMENPVNINGLTTRTKAIVKSVQVLTCRNDLYFLTLLSLESILSTEDSLLRTNSFWCPLCYQDWASKGKPNYDPLLWRIKFNYYCDKHSIPLVCECSQCKMKHKVLTSNSVSGYCPHCKSFLGNTSIFPINEERCQGELWVTRGIGELLEKFKEIEQKKSEIDIKYNISLLIQSISNENLYAFSKISGIHRTTLATWKNKKSYPKFELILSLCKNLEITPLQLLFLEVPLNKVIKARNNIKEKKYVSTYKKYDRGKFDENGLKEKLENILASNENPPPSLSEVRRRIGIDYSTVKKFCPELCSQIVDKHREYTSYMHNENIKTILREIKEIVRTLNSKGVYPSPSKLNKHLSKPAYLKNPKIYAAYKEMLDELGLQKRN